MNELNDLFRVISEGKKMAIESNPGKKILSKLKEELHTTNPFLTEYQSVTEKKPSKQDLVKESGQDSLQESLNDIDDFINPLSIDYIEKSTLVTQPIQPEIKPASEIYSQAEIEKYLRRNASFQQPNPDKPEPTIQAIQDKVKFLEQAIGRIAATGPGSGETWFRWLDDVDRSTIDIPEANQEHVLRYNSITKKFFFGELVGDHREINSFTFNVDGPSIEKTPRMVYWNKSEDCLNIAHQDGSTLQTGLEQHMRVVNGSPDVLHPGTLVGFADVQQIDGDELPVVVPYTATSTAIPLYIVGVLTTDIIPGGIGRATTFGKVRNLDTTGDSGLGETWVTGDLLWAHPTMPGRLTKHQPTAPYPAISVAAILRSDSTSGVLLVRPTIFPRLWFGRFRDTTNQIATQIDTPYAVTFNDTAIAAGLYIDPNDTSHVVATNTGLYKFDIRLQFTSSNSSTSKIWVWYRLNGVDVENVATEYTISSNGGVVVATLPYIVSLQQNDYIQIMWAVNNTAVGLLSLPPTSFAPGSPCAVIAASQVNL